jgi:ABC-2 type transport system ATP-binding protein
MDPFVRVEALSKAYRVPVREAGIQAAIRSLFNRKTRKVHAVTDISFDVPPGEIVGFLGPNGAGKTTTLKMLSGLLHPTGGDARVLGHQPWQRQREYLRQMTLVMGQRNQLMWDIPVIDSFDRNRVIYQIGMTDYRTRVDELAGLLDLGELLNKPVRNLSLGERMKCEIAAALLHFPKVLFLDEPTIGLDVTMQRRLREFVRAYNERTGASVLLTSHYMADVQALCERVIVIHHGRILFDGSLSELVHRTAAWKTISVEIDASRDELERFGEVIEHASGRASLRVPKREAAQVAGAMLAELQVFDLTIEDPPIDEVIEQVFSAETAMAADAGSARLAESSG